MSDDNFISEYLRIIVKEWNVADVMNAIYGDCNNEEFENDNYKIIRYYTTPELLEIIDKRCENRVYHFIIPELKVEICKCDGDDYSIKFIGWI